MTQALHRKPYMLIVIVYESNAMYLKLRDFILCMVRKS